MADWTPMSEERINEIEGYCLPSAATSALGDLMALDLVAELRRTREALREAREDGARDAKNAREIERLKENRCRGQQ